MLSRFPGPDGFAIFDGACKACAVAAQPGHTKELQSVQLEHGLRIVDSPGIIFEDNDSIQGQKESSLTHQCFCATLSNLKTSTTQSP
jgi:GTP-binding protein EngB required for normal cell division